MLDTEKFYKKIESYRGKRKRCSDENLTHEILAKIIFKYYFRK